VQHLIQVGVNARKPVAAGHVGRQFLVQVTQPGQLDLSGVLGNVARQRGQVVSPTVISRP
jgi:hypothetical protein